MIERFLIRLSHWTRDLAFKRLRKKYPSEWADIDRHLAHCSFTLKRDEFLHEASAHLLGKR